MANKTKIETGKNKSAGPLKAAGKSKSAGKIC